MIERITNSQGTSHESTEDPFNVLQKTESAHIAVTSLFEKAGGPTELLASGKIRPASILYMAYWYHRLRNNQDERSNMRDALFNYLRGSVRDPMQLADTLFASADIRSTCTEYVEQLMAPARTIDLVVVNETKPGEKSVLTYSRDAFPKGPALPGGFIRDEDEDNELGVSGDVFAALRIAGDKILGAGAAVRYERKTDDRGREYFLVRGAADTPAVRLHAEDEAGYRFRENVKSVLRPSDPRHIVDTIGYTCELIGEPEKDLSWRSKADIMSQESSTGGFAFGHHREIVAHITARTSVEKERELKEREFVRGIFSEPLSSYRSLRARFETNHDSVDTSFPELFPVVDKLLSESFTDDINELCRTTPIIAGIRDKMVISLRHVSLKNRTFCPYLPTLRAIAESIAFFDLVARHKKGFYESMPKDAIVEHNPAKTPHASYHMYRYKYRYDEMMGMVPHEIVIPSFEELSATNLMQVRAVPIRFVGLSKDFLYVDEFEQSPEEFFMHDANHSWRMIMEDRKAEEKYGRTREQLIEESATFSKEYLDHIKIRKSDTEEQKELKKLKKIILFEIVHEDARPFLKDVIGSYIQLKEGSPVPFEVPHIDTQTGYMDVVDTLDTGISTLSYVRNKLQHGFYDQVDAQLPQIVGPQYRTAAWIAKAAYEMLAELGALPQKGADLDTDGRISYEWLLKRTCAAGPDNIHNTDFTDPEVEKFGDATDRLNPKRYQA